MPINTANRIMDKVDDYAANPESQANNVRSLKGSGEIRLRVGDWRVIMVETDVIDVVKIKPRGRVYK